MVEAQCLDGSAVVYEHIGSVPPQQESDSPRPTFARDPITGGKIVVEEFSIDPSNQEAFVDYLRAIGSHPCLERILSWRILSDSNGVEIHTEWVESGSLKSLLKCSEEKGHLCLTATEKAKIVTGIVLGMRFIHSCGFVHGCLKASNVIINDSGHPLIHGLPALCLRGDQSVWVSEPRQSDYDAPEVLAGDPPTTASDVCSFGSLLSEILIGSAVPSSEFGYGMHDTYKIPLECGSLMQDLIRQCWSIDPKSRPTFNDIFSEFQSARFDIHPGADSSSVREYVKDVLCCEERNPPSQLDKNVGSHQDYSPPAFSPNS
jgi:serine/threonine protein kinase